ncbi:hypothetical protein [Lysobacter gummosus]|uniref:hypothetical protein n=1 Tax=Lysobacter gummosus TaxID=262324 RepID=UPI0036401F8A
MRLVDGQDCVCVHRFRRADVLACCRGFAGPPRRYSSRWLQHPSRRVGRRAERIRVP